MAALAQMTAVINAELSGTTAAGTDALAPATGERLERWIERHSKTSSGGSLPCIHVVRSTRLQIFHPPVVRTSSSW